MGIHGLLSSKFLKGVSKMEERSSPVLRFINQALYNAGVKYMPPTGQSKVGEKRPVVIKLHTRPGARKCSAFLLCSPSLMLKAELKSDLIVRFVNGMPLLSHHLKGLVRRRTKNGI